MAAEPSNAENSAPLEATASAWLARRDRGLTAAEQDAYLEWLRADPRHGAMIAHLEKTWGALDALAEWRPAHSARPNPDLLATPRARPRRWARLTKFPFAVRTLAAAAAVALGVFVLQSNVPETPPSSGTVRVIPTPERLTLEDGSVVELNHGGKLEIDFSSETRRVRLVRGEAHFTVTKNPARPFIVEANGVAVRAVGTAFNVRHSVAAIEVLVTEGQVQVERSIAVVAASAPTPLAPAPTALVAGERAIVDTTAPAAQPVVAAVTPTEIAHALSWQGVRLEFAELPLAEVVTEFNLRNRQQLVVDDATTGRLRVGGSFRADNVDGFVRLLEASFGVSAQRRADGALVLRHQK
ncbi:MAG: FecR domain-containing protein [Verrucomicrobia bacterium]|nr:FecR domain-containing protein [Verrucomicrobiota bacterium]